MPLEVRPLSFQDNVCRELKRSAGRAEVVGPWGSSKSMLAVRAAEALGVSLLMVAPGRIEAEAIFDDLCTFAGEERVALFPAWEVLPSDTMNPADDIVAERMNTLKRLAAASPAGEAMHVVMPVRALLQRVIHPKRLTGDTLTLDTGKEVDLEDLLEALIKLGYEREVMVEHRGQVSVRGGIVDIFPISSALPCRVEFFGDEIESIRYFEPETQRSVEVVERLQILPRSEKRALAGLAQSPEALAVITAYFGKDALVVLDEPLSITEEAAQLERQLRDERFYLSWEEAETALGKRPRLSLMQVGKKRDAEVPRFRFPTKSVSGFQAQVDAFWEQLEAWDLGGYSVRLLCINTGERRRLHELLEERGYRPGQDAFDLRVSIGRIRAGFDAPSEKLAILSESEMFGRTYRRRKRRRFEAGSAITQFSDLKTGDYIVHQLHGIGRYLGLRRFEGKAGDFMAIQYAAGDMVYVPAHHIDHVQKYVGGDGAMPKIDKVGGASWARTKAKVKKAVREMTADLIQLYARRENSRGHAFSVDTPWQSEFEDSFEYDETPDQARAITETKRDMEGGKPMDRLLCGDVGYGKTEVALRAAFKAVQDGKQTALLAPTTVLTQQHFSTFRERMADFPVRIELLNRFRTPKQQRLTVERMKSGEVDIVIGTHRLVSKDVNFKDLGLLIIDEEQRFGVAHKERIKKLRHHVDVLTLTATPIPRTLHISLMGVRDMSVINTAPNDRLPIHTCIESWDENLVKEAMERELSREGQVFLLHNRVQTIGKVAELVRRLVPTARVAVGHGQMHKHELEEVMRDFIDNKVDVLVCTTIIGSGIDIPNANTIIIDRADMFGLSELYQIRGRVGRYKHRAFAYLLIPGDRALSEDAQLRLQALEDFSALGSGFRIAMRDLEIRGAGNVLGGEQSGHITTVGYETYKDLIAEAVSELKGTPMKRRVLPPFEVGVDAFVPDEYVPTAQQKMTLYRRISQANALDEIEEIDAELNDRFGTPPGPVRRLLDIMRVRAAAADAGAKKVVGAKNMVTVEFENATSLDRRSQDRLRQAYGDTVVADLFDTPTLRYRLGAGAKPIGEALALLRLMTVE